MDDLFMEEFRKFAVTFNIRMDRLESRLDGLEKRFEDMEENINTRFVEMEKKFNMRFTEIEEKFNMRFAEMDEKFNRKFLEIEERFENVNTMIEGLYIMNNMKFNYIDGKLVRVGEILLKKKKATKR